MIKKENDVLSFYAKAKEVCLREGYSYEMEAVKKRNFNDASVGMFLYQYVYVVLNPGMKNQIAERMFRRFWESQDLKTIGHQGKRLAIASAMRNYSTWFGNLLNANDKVSYPETLPWIGPITKFHLARNLGIDVAKPDCHLSRLCSKFGFSNVQEMCGHVSQRTGDRVGVVDVVLWRASNLGLVA